MTVFFWLPETTCIVPTVGPGFLMHDDPSGRTQMLYVGIPELPLIEWAKQFGDKNKVFLDCGAHMGAYSILLADSFKSVFAFEAQRRTYMQLCGNIFLNEKHNVTPFYVALSSPEDEGKTVKLSIVSEDGGGSTICEATESVITQEEVAATTIDSYGIQNVGLIKLDIEGNEFKALKGAEITILRYRPHILFEVNKGDSSESKKTNIFSFFKARGYQVAEIKPFDNMFYAAPMP